MADRLDSVRTPPPDAVREMTELRSRSAKTWERPDGKRTTRVAIGASLHVPDNIVAWEEGDPFTWVDSDLAIRDAGTHLAIGAGWYSLEISKTAVSWRYLSRRGGEVTVTLSEVDGVPLVGAPTPALAEERVSWRNVLPGLDIVLHCATAKVSVWKYLRTASAPRSWVWTIQQSEPLAASVSLDIRGWDNIDWSDAGRAGSGYGQVRRQAEMVITPSAQTPIVGGVQYTVTETWTGRVFALDPATRIKTPSRDAAYPVGIDQDITENIAADADDGSSRYYNAADYRWETGSGGNTRIKDYSPILWGGWRFLTVAIPAGSTIDDATLILDGDGGDPDTLAIVYGFDMDSVGAFNSTDHNPHWAYVNGDLTAASNNHDWIIGTNNVDVKAIVQEIVDRGGWASGNNLGFAAIAQDAAYHPYIYIGDYASGGGAPAVLEINYTEGGAPVVSAVNETATAQAESSSAGTTAADQITPVNETATAQAESPSAPTALEVDQTTPVNETATAQAESSSAGTTAADQITPVNETATAQAESSSAPTALEVDQTTPVNETATAQAESSSAPTTLEEDQTTPVNETATAQAESLSAGTTAADQTTPVNETATAQAESSSAPTTLEVDQTTPVNETATAQAESSSAGTTIPTDVFTSVSETTTAEAEASDAATELAVAYISARVDSSAGFQAVVDSSAGFQAVVDSE